MRVSIAAAALVASASGSVFSRLENKAEHDVKYSVYLGGADEGMGADGKAIYKGASLGWGFEGQADDMCRDGGYEMLMKPFHGGFSDELLNTPSPALDNFEARWNSMQGDVTMKDRVKERFPCIATSKEDLLEHNAGMRTCYPYDCYTKDWPYAGYFVACQPCYCGQYLQSYYAQKGDCDGLKKIRDCKQNEMNKVFKLKATASSAETTAQASQAAYEEAIANGDVEAAQQFAHANTITQNSVNDLDYAQTIHTGDFEQMGHLALTQAFAGRRLQEFKGTQVTSVEMATRLLSLYEENYPGSYPFSYPPGKFTAMNEMKEFTFVKEVDILIWQCEAKVGLDPTPKLGMIGIFSRLVMGAYFFVEKVFGWSTSFFLAAMVPSGSAVPTAVATFPLYTGDADPFGTGGYLSTGASSVLEMKCFDSEAACTPGDTKVGTFNGDYHSDIGDKCYFDKKTNSLKAYSPLISVQGATAPPDSFCWWKEPFGKWFWKKWWWKYHYCCKKDFLLGICYYPKPAGTYVIADPAIFGGLPVAAVPDTRIGDAPFFLAPLSPAFKDGGIGSFSEEEWVTEVASLATLAGTPSDLYQALATSTLAVLQGGDAEDLIPM